MEPRSPKTNPGDPIHLHQAGKLGTSDLDDLLRSRLPGLCEDGWRLASFESHVLKESRFKPVVSYDLNYRDHSDGSTRRDTVIAKGYHRGASGRPTYQAMQALWQNGLGSDPSLTIAAPVAYFDDIDLLLQAEAPGDMLYDYIREPQAALDDLPRIGRWLAKLHSVTAPAPPVVPPADPWLRIEPRLAELVATRPDFAARVERIGLAVERGLASNGRIVDVPLHGDFQPKNIILHDGRVSVIDFDHFTYGEAARDVAYFVVQNLTMSYSKNGSFAPVAAWNTAFLEGYASARGTESLHRLPLFAAMAFLHILHYKLCVLPVRDASFVPAWLDLCERWLENGSLGATP